MSSARRRPLLICLTLVLGACSGGSNEDTPDATVPEGPSATDAAGTFTFSTSTCSYEGPEIVPEGELSFVLTSVSGQADFDLWRMKDGHGYEELVAHIAEEVRRAEEGLPGLGHPTSATLVAESTTDGEGNGILTASVGAGVYGMACVRPGEGAFAAAGPFATGSVALDPVGDALDRIVLAADMPPTGTEFYEELTITGVGAATHAIGDPDVRAAVQQGFVDGLLRGFLTPSLVEASDAGLLDDYAKKFDGSGHLVLASIAFAYLDEASAQAALEVYIRNDTETSGLEVVERLDVGDGGVRLEGRATYAEGMPTIAYLWRSGRYVLAINSNGSVEADADEIRSIAEGMQARSG